MAFVHEICRSECEWPLYERSVGVNVQTHVPRRSIAMCLYI